MTDMSKAESNAGNRVGGPRKSMAETLELIRGISQAIANSYDGGHDERYSYDGEARKTGLRREENDCMLDTRISDGFMVKFYGDKLCIHYHAEIPLSDVHENGFESDVESLINGVKKYLVSEYKKVTGDTLSLTKDGDSDIIVQSISRVRTSVQASQYYKIGGLKGVEPSREAGEHKVDDAIRKWLELGKKSPKPMNVTRKK